MSKKSILWVVLVVALVLVGVIYTKNTKSSSGINIGAIYALTGGASKFGEMSIQGVKDAALFYEQEKGEKVTLHVEDSAGDPKQGVSAAQKLFSVDKIKFAVVGQAGVTSAVSPVAESEKVLLITDAVTYGITKDKKFLFQGEFPSLNDIAKQINATPKYNKVAIVYINDDFGVKVNESLVADIEKTRTVQSFKFEKDQKDFRTDATKIKQFSPDAIVVIGYGASLNVAFGDMHTLNVGGDYLTYLACTLPGVLTDKKFSLEGQTSYEFPDKISPRIEKFISGRKFSDNTFYRLAFGNTLTAIEAYKASNGDAEKAVAFLHSNTLKEWMYGDVTFGDKNYSEINLAPKKISNGACVPLTN